MERLATVAIVGRPNVGKSTLFNRLVGRRRAITLDTPGVTRDPITEEVNWDGHRLRVVDTGGLGGEVEIDLAQPVHEHTLRSAGAADLVVVVFDARAGVNPLDAETVEVLKRLEVPTLFVANKAEGAAQDDSVVEFCTLGIDPPLTVSAEHGLGITHLRTCIVERLAELGRDGPGADDEAPADQPAAAGMSRACRVALVGRPNVGKSSLLNAVAGEAIALVDDAPGTTRDVVDTLVEHDGREYLFVDTAGMRRPARVVRGVESLSVNRSLEAVRRADVVVLLVEPDEGVTDQDARIASFAWDEGRALVLMMNKIDLAPDVSHADLERETQRRYPTLSVVPMRFMSVTAGHGLDGLFSAIDRANRAHSAEVRTSTLNRILAQVAERREPPMISGGRLRLFYAAQTANRPPTFTVFVNREAVPTDYTRFIERCFRESLPLEGTPLRLRFKRRPSHGPERA
jgi:GTP-binding protein